jgi:hypothetical protein
MWVGSIAKLLMLALIRDLETEGMRGAIATAGTPVSCRLCESIGFTAIDPPQRTGLHPDPMINIGMVFGSPQHIRAQKECGMWQGGEPVLSPEAVRLLRYFEERRAALSDARPIAAILADA